MHLRSLLLGGCWGISSSGLPWASTDGTYSVISGSGDKVGTLPYLRALLALVFLAALACLPHHTVLLFYRLSFLVGSSQCSQCGQISILWGGGRWAVCVFLVLLPWCWTKRFVRLSFGLGDHGSRTVWSTVISRFFYGVLTVAPELWHGLDCFFLKRITLTLSLLKFTGSFSSFFFF